MNDVQVVSGPYIGLFGRLISLINPHLIEIDTGNGNIHVTCLYDGEFKFIKDIDRV